MYRITKSTIDAIARTYAASPNWWKYLYEIVGEEPPTELKEYLSYAKIWSDVVTTE